MTQPKVLYWLLVSYLGLVGGLHPQDATNPPAVSVGSPVAEQDSQFTNNQNVKGRGPGAWHRGPHLDRPWSRPEWEQRRRELQQLPPEEIRARIRQWRRERLAHWPEARGLTPEECRQKRAQMRTRLEEALLELRQKKEQGTLDPQEERRLRRLLELEKRFRIEPEGGEAGPSDKPAGEERDPPG